MMGVPTELIEATYLDMEDGHSIQYLDTEKGLIFDIAVPVLKSRAGILHIGF